MGINIGGYRDFPPGNVKGKEDDGIVRVPGENEPDPLTAKGLSEPEVLLAEENEAYNKKELKILEDILADNKFFDTRWKALAVLQNSKIKEEIIKKLPPQFRYGKLEEHLKTLATQER